MKLSIIIPVYNAEKYLQKCLESIVYQELDQKNFEIILINDGSTDSSLEIAQSFGINISNYKIITHENQGEAASRNVGLHLSRGEFVTFLDNDDYYEKNTLRGALEIVEENNLDMLYLKINRVNELGEFLSTFQDMSSAGQILPGLIHERRPLPATIYRKNTIASFTFSPEIFIGTDSIFNAMVQSQSSKVSYTKDFVYCYTEREGNLSKKGYSDKAFSGYIKAIKILSNFKRTYFPQSHLLADQYFEKIITIFATRIIELNILPSFDLDKYDLLVATLKEENSLYILDLFASKYPYVNTSFLSFKGYQKYLKLKSIIYNLIYRV